MDLKVYQCAICGNILTPLHDSQVVPFCCGQKMEVVKANTKDAALEKHVPEVTVNQSNVTIKVGAVMHPSVEAHYIEFIILLTNKGIHVRYIKPGQDPVATFDAKDETLVAAYEYCNLHGLWKKDL